MSFMASPKMKPSLLLFSIVLLLTSLHAKSSSLDSKLTALKDLCKSRPYPAVCFDSLKLSVGVGVGGVGAGVDIDPTMLTFLITSLRAALSEAGKLSHLFSGGQSNIVETLKGTLQDCDELHQITISSLQKSISWIVSATTFPDSRKLADTRAFLTAALTNKVTCLEGLESAYGPYKPVLISSITNAYKYISNSLSLFSEKRGGGAPSSKINGQMHRRLMDFPSWISKKDRRILQGSEDEDDSDQNSLTVAADGSGNFTTITDAINFAPNNSDMRIIIYVKQGTYEEHVEIPSWKTNIVLLGDGSDVTVITGNRSVGDGWTTFRSATVAVSGVGFLARDITFRNTAGPAKHQAVALRVNADFVACYRCTVRGYQDSLYTHSFRQFYRECDIYGTIDYIFGNAAAVFQGCNLISRLPLPGQFTVITAQSKDDPNEFTGISIQNCSILPTVDLYNASGRVKNYLGRPWKNYSTTVIMKSYVDDHIAKEGWTIWSGDNGLDTSYYGEYENNGPGSGTYDRVDWPAFHVMDHYDASDYKVSEFISGDEWLDSTSFPYDNGV